MNEQYTHVLARITKHFSVEVQAVQTGNGSPSFDDLYTEAKPRKGVTIPMPSSHQTNPYNSGIHYRGQYTPRQLAKDYAAQGIENPEQEAMISLQRELAHYIDADECYLLVSVFIHGIDKPIVKVGGGSFDYSYDYCGDIDEYVRKYRGDFNLRDTVKEACTEAREAIRKIQSIHLRSKPCPEPT